MLVELDGVLESALEEGRDLKGVCIVEVGEEERERFSKTRLWQRSILLSCTMLVYYISLSRLQKTGDEFAFSAELKNDILFPLEIFFPFLCLDLGSDSINLTDCS